MAERNGGSEGESEGGSEGPSKDAGAKDHWALVVLAIYRADALESACACMLCGVGWSVKESVKRLTLRDGHRGKVLRLLHPLEVTRRLLRCLGVEHVDTDVDTDAVCGVGTCGVAPLRRGRRMEEGGR